MSKNLLWDGNSFTYDGNTDVTVDRNKYIGGSDCGAILGHNTYTSPLDTCLNKRGEGTEFNGNESTRIGDAMEDFTRDVLLPLKLKELGVDNIEIFKSDYTYYSSAYPWMNAHIDGIVKHPEYGQGVLELKAFGPDSYPYWSLEKFPTSYLYQVLHYMIVMNANWAILFGACGTKLELRYIFRDDYKLEIQSIIEKEQEFYERYMDGLEYPPATSQDSNGLLSMYPDCEDKVVELPLSFEPWFDEYLQLTATEKDAKSKKSMIQNKFKEFLGKSKFGTLGAHKATWTRKASESFDTALFKKENPELLRKYTKKSTYSRLTIK